MFRTRRGCAGIAGLQFRKLAFERAAGFDDGALRGNGGAEAATGRTGVEIRVGFSRAEFRDPACNADLSIERGPIQHQRGARIPGQLAPLAAQIVGEERKAAVVDAFEQDHARGGLAVGRGGSERHSGGLFDARGAGEVEPFLDFTDRISHGGRRSQSLVYGFSLDAVHRPGHFDTWLPLRCRRGSVANGPRPHGGDWRDKRSMLFAPQLAGHGPAPHIRSRLVKNGV